MSSRHLGLSCVSGRSCFSNPAAGMTAVIFSLCCCYLCLLACLAALATRRKAEKEEQQPNREFLAERFERFRAA